MAGIKDAVGNIITSGLDFANASFNRRSIKRQNEADRQHAIDMYNRQRADNLADWNMQNQYNHPEQQMERLRQAGLNPNLVYGKGADNTAAAINKSSYQENKQQAPTMDFSFQNALTSYLSAQNAAATNDNLSKQNELMAADIRMREAQAENEKAKKVGQDLQNIRYGIDNKLLDFDYSQKLRLADTVFEDKILDVALKSQSKQLNANYYELAKIKNSSDVASAYANQLESEARTDLIKLQKIQSQGKYTLELESMKKEIAYKQAQIESLRKQGVLLDGQTAIQAIDKMMKQEQAGQQKFENKIKRTQSLMDMILQGPAYFNQQKNMGSPKFNLNYTDKFIKRYEYEE